MFPHPVSNYPRRGDSFKNVVRARQIQWGSISTEYVVEVRAAQSLATRLRFGTCLGAGDEVACSSNVKICMTGG